MAMNDVPQTKFPRRRELNFFEIVAYVLGSGAAWVLGDTFIGEGYGRVAAAAWLVAFTLYNLYIAGISKSSVAIMLSALVLLLIVYRWPLSR